jgi:hypothetical protein
MRFRLATPRTRYVVLALNWGEDEGGWPRNLSKRLGPWQLLFVVAVKQWIDPPPPPTRSQTRQCMIASCDPSLGCVTTPKDCDGTALR